MSHRPPTFDLVLSAENNPYQMWQAMLFHYSCMTHQHVAPLVIVHKRDEPLLEGFQRIAAAGGRVQVVGNFREVGGFDYPPRNTPASLRLAETDAEYVVLCEPDMVFLKPMGLEQLTIGANNVTFDRLTYLDAERAEYQPALDEVCRRLDVDPQVLRTQPINGGVPHIVATRRKAEFADEWTRGLELFVQIAGERAKEEKEPMEINWVSGMWSTVLAMHRLRLEPVFTQFCISNEKGTQPLLTIGPGDPAIIH
jgi:hypothetical protein